MNKITFELEGREYIELMKLLKYEGVADSGAEAKLLIDAGEIFVNGEPEQRRRRKLRGGDEIAFGEYRIIIKK